MPVRAWKARKTLTESFRRLGAPIPLTKGFQVARNRASLLQSPFARNRQSLGWQVVVDHRCYSDGGLGFSPDGFRLRSRRCRNRGCSVVLGYTVGVQRWNTLCTPILLPIVVPHWKRENLYRFVPAERQNFAPHGVLLRLDAAPKPQRSKAATPSRATRDPGL